MARPRTAEQFEDALSAELVWRKVELSALKKVAIQSSQSMKRNKAVLRGSVALLYAHWEGFIKNAAELYVSFVAYKNLKYGELSVNFVALAMKVKLDLANGSRKASIHNDAARFLLDHLDQRCDMSSKGAIDTESNLSSVVLFEIAQRIGIDYKPYALKSQIIDDRLLNTRNKVAHGEYIDIDYDSYFELHKEVLSMMEIFRNQISNAVATEQFLRVNSEKLHDSNNASVESAT